MSSGKIVTTISWSERARLEQEVARLDGRFAHVLTESIDSKRDDVANEAWLYGRFTYVLYR